MFFQKLLPFILLITISIYGVEDTSSAELLFKSSFEDGVYLNRVQRRNSSVWWQDLKGYDNSNFSWPIKLKDKKGTIQMIVDSHKDVNSYIINKIERIIGIDGNLTKALHQIVKKKDSEVTQTPYVLYTNDQEYKRIYIRYSLKFPKNLLDLLGHNGWLIFCEYKTKNDNRLAFYIYSDADKRLSWHLHSDNIAGEKAPKSRKEYWFKDNKKIAVPQGEWFDIELFWYRSLNDDGRVWWAVNGQVINDYHGRVKIKEPIHEIMLFTNYSNSPIHQWIDNIEIWDNFPCGKGMSCHDYKNKKGNL
jgi:hypothetical protein